MPAPDDPGMADYLRSAYASIMNGGNIFFEAAGNAAMGMSRYNSPMYDFGQGLVERAHERTRVNTQYVLSNTETQRTMDAALTAVTAAVGGVALAVVTRGRSVLPALGGLAAGTAVQQALPTYNDASSLDRIVGDTEEKVKGDIARVVGNMEKRRGPLSVGDAVETAVDSIPALFLSDAGKFGGFQPVGLAADVAQGLSSISAERSINRIARRDSSEPVVGMLKQTANASAGYALSKANIKAIPDSLAAFLGEYAANASSDTAGTRESAELVLRHARNLESVARQNRLREQQRRYGIYNGSTYGTNTVPAYIERLLGNGVGDELARSTSPTP